jgi:hypothetical protein
MSTNISIDHYQFCHLAVSRSKKEVGVQCVGKLLPTVAKDVTQDNVLKPGGEFYSNKKIKVFFDNMK